MATDRQRHKEEKAALIKQALPPKTVLRSSLNEYKIVEVLGAGGFGITYKVSANLLVGNVTVISYFVIKEHFLKGCWRGNDKTSVLHAPTMETDVRQSRKDFIEEARRLNKIGQKTPNIVKVNEVFEANGTAYYVMEYLDGGDLRTYVHKHDPLTEEKAVGLIVIVAKAVVALHENHLLHLDIKPDNIVLKTDLETGRQIPVLIDFGIAKHFDKSGRPTSHLVAKGASEGYAPMEQYSEINHFAPEIDVYALGATLYFLLTGKNPPKAFDIHSFNDIQDNLPPGLGDQTVTALAAAMRPGKHERTGNVRLFVRNLDGEYITGNETDIFPPDPDPDPNIWKYILSFLAAAFLIVLVFWFIPDKKKAAVPTPDEEEAVDSILEIKKSEQESITSTDEAKSESSETSAKITPVTPNTETSEVKETKNKEETDDQKYTKAVASGDVSALKKLADKGYAKAYSKLAALYLENRKYASADTYAQKAYNAGVGRQEAIEVMEMLQGLRYYDGKDLPAALKK